MTAVVLKGAPLQPNLEWHKRAGAQLAASLDGGDAFAWQGFSDWIEELLTAPERASIAWAALKSLNHDEAEQVMHTVARFAGGPLPTFLSPMNDARWWASLASREELKAYCLASFEALTETDRRAFLNHVSGKGRDAA